MKTILAAAMVFLAGCAHVEERPAQVGFAITTASDPDLHVLARKVNAMQPIMVGVAGEDVTITYATRGVEGVTLHLDPATFTVRGSEPYQYEAQASRRHARCLELQTAYRGTIQGIDVVGTAHVVQPAGGKGILAFFMSDEEGIFLAAMPLR